VRRNLARGTVQGRARTASECDAEAGAGKGEEAARRETDACSPRATRLGVQCVRFLWRWRRDGVAAYGWIVAGLWPGRGGGEYQRGQPGVSTSSPSTVFTSPVLAVSIVHVKMLKYAEQPRSARDAPAITWRRQKLKALFVLDKGMMSLTCPLSSPAMNPISTEVPSRSC